MKLILSLLFVFLVLFPFGQLTRLPLSLISGNLAKQFPEVHLYFTDIILTILLAYWLMWRFFLMKKKDIFPPLAKPILFFLFIAFLSLVFNTPRLLGREVLVAGLYWLRLATYFGLYFVLADFKSFFKSRQILNFLIVVGAAMAIFGLIQYWLWPDLSTLTVLAWDPHYYRIIGTFLDPGFSGLIYVLTLVLLVILNWEKLSRFKRTNLGLYCLLLLVYSALALTYSRSAYLAYLVAMGVIAWFKRKPQFFLVILLVGLFTILVLPRSTGGEGVRLERTASVQARFGNWQQALTIFQDYPFLGVGFNAYRYTQRDYGFLAEKNWQISHAGAGADSSFLFILATTGIIGFLAYAWLGLSAIRLSLAKVNAKNGLVVFASIMALGCHAFFLNSLFYPWLLAWLGIILSLL